MIGSVIVKNNGEKGAGIMKLFKKLSLVLAFLLMAAPAFARTTFVMPVIATNSTVIQAYATGCTVYTTSMDVRDAASFAVSLEATATTLRVPNITVVMEQSFRKPTVEGQADTYWSTTSTTAVATAYAVNSTNWYHQAITVAALPYARFKITGNTGNSTDTTVQMNLTKQYDV